MAARASSINANAISSMCPIVDISHTITFREMAIMATRTTISTCTISSFKKAFTASRSSTPISIVRNKPISCVMCVSINSVRETIGNTFVYLYYDI